MPTLPSPKKPSDSQELKESMTNRFLFKFTVDGQFSISPQKLSYIVANSIKQLCPILLALTLIYPKPHLPQHSPLPPPAESENESSTY
jgi:hypothetical protein